MTPGARSIHLGSGHRTVLVGEVDQFQHVGHGFYITSEKSPKTKLVAYFVGCYPDYKSSLETIKFTHWPMPFIPFGYR